MAYTYEDMLFTKEDSLAIITLNRPDKLNALTTEDFYRMQDLMALAELEDDIHSIVVRGAGDCFSTGADAALLGHLHLVGLHLALLLRLQGCHLHLVPLLDQHGVVESFLGVQLLGLEGQLLLLDLQVALYFLSLICASWALICNSCCCIWMIGSCICCWACC
jgi:hypothetical protein